MKTNIPIILNERMIKEIRLYVWKRDLNDCWPWCRSKSDRGYGHFRIGPILYKAHRVAYVIANGPFDWDLEVCHSCDNPRCCNPTHLFVGTHTDNMQDISLKGGWNNRKGEANGRSCLTQADVLKIRFDFQSGVSKEALASKYLVSRVTITDIVTYRTWKHI